MMRLMEWLVGSPVGADRVEELEEQLGQVQSENVALLADLNQVRNEAQQLRTTNELQRALIRTLRDVNADLDGRLQ